MKTRTKETWRAMPIWQKALNVIIFLVVLSFLIALVQVVTAKIANANGCARTPDTTKTRYLGDKRHGGVFLDRMDIKAHACLDRRGRLQSAGANMYHDPNSVAAMLGYRYGSAPGSSDSWRKKGWYKVWALDGYYRQCLPGPLGQIACGPTGTYTAHLTYWSPAGKRAAKRDGINISCTWCFGTSKNSNYAKTFMLINNTKWGF